MVKKIVFSNNPLFSGPSIGERKDNQIPYRVIKLSAIDRDSNQPRVNFDEDKLNELSASIKKYGLLTPILVRPGAFPGKFIIIAGERRFRASKLAGLSEIPTIVDEEVDETGETILAKQLVENIQRAELKPLEKAYAISALKEVNDLSIRSIADSLGISKSSVQRSLDLLDLPDDLINALRQGASESKILMLSKINDEKERAKYLSNLDEITRDQIKTKVKSKIKKPATNALSAEDRRVQEEIQKALGMKVSFSRNKKNSEAGKISIDFSYEKDLQVIFRKLVS